MWFSNNVDGFSKLSEFHFTIVIAANNTWPCASIEFIVGKLSMLYLNFLANEALILRQLRWWYLRHIAWVWVKWIDQFFFIDFKISQHHFLYCLAAEQAAEGLSWDWATFNYLIAYSFQELFIDLQALVRVFDNQIQLFFE